MHSYTSIFKSFIVIAAIISAAEYTAQQFSGDFYDVFFIGFSPSHKPVAQKVIIHDKLTHLPGEDVQTIVAGDSSGLFGFMPEYAEKNGLPHTINIACCGDMGFDGYRYAAEYAIQHSPQVKNLILHVAPQIPPDTYGEPTELGTQIQRAFLFPGRLFHWPSQHFKMAFLNWLYFNKTDGRLPPLGGKVKIPGFENADDLRHALKRTSGWLPLDWHHEVKRDQCHKQISPERFGSYGDIWGSFEKLSQKHSISLFIYFNPMPCDPHDQYNPWDKLIEKWKSEYPGIIFLNKITSFEEIYFSDHIHLNTKGAEKNSQHIAQLMKEHIKSHE